MISRHALVVAVNDLEKTLKQSAGIAKRNPTQSLEAVDLRRKISVKRVAISRLSEQSFETGHAEQEFRGRFAELCAALVDHQSAWPIVCVDVQNPAYVRSVTRMRKVCGEFFEWFRRQQPYGSQH